MNTNFANLNLVDLISEKHIELRRVTEKRWEQSANYEISHTEAHLLARINQETLSITQAAKLLNISRQAMQKCAQHLESRGFILFEHKAGNSRDKYMQLTSTGSQYCRDSDLLKKKIEEEIAAILGSQNVDKMKKWLKLKWADTDQY